MGLKFPSGRSYRNRTYDKCFGDIYVTSTPNSYVKNHKFNLWSVEISTLIIIHYFINSIKLL